MSRSGYFDTPANAEGFTWRTYYQESGGIVTLTDFQLQSITFAGPNWYPKGQVAVNGEPLLEMDYNDNATHMFAFGSASDTFTSITTLTGQSLPVGTQKISAGKAEISVSMELYRSSDGKHTYGIEGSTIIDVASILAMVHDGEEFAQKQPVIRHDTGAKNYRPIVHNGAGWSE